MVEFHAVWQFAEGGNLEGDKVEASGNSAVKSFSPDEGHGLQGCSLLAFFDVFLYSSFL